MGSRASEGRSDSGCRIQFKSLEISLAYGVSCTAETVACKHEPISTSAEQPIRRGRVVIQWIVAPAYFIQRRTMNPIVPRVAKIQPTQPIHPGNDFECSASMRVGDLTRSKKIIIRPTTATMVEINRTVSNGVMEDFSCSHLVADLLILSEGCDEATAC